MQEFSSISVSTYEPDGLVGQLNDKAADGWSVVAIVPTGNNVTAYLVREAAGAATSESPAADVEPVVEPEVEPAPEPSSEPFMPSAATVVTPEPAPQPVAEPAPQPVAEPAAQPVAQATASAAPAGWYADPSGRFELRYWDGTTWTEHVSRAGQQSTDPPVA